MFLFHFNWYFLRGVGYFFSTLADTSHAVLFTSFPLYLILSKRCCFLIFHFSWYFLRTVVNFFSTLIDAFYEVLFTSFPLQLILFRKCWLLLFHFSWHFPGSVGYFWVFVIIFQFQVIFPREWLLFHFHFRSYFLSKFDHIYIYFSSYFLQWVCYFISNSTYMCRNCFHLLVFLVSRVPLLLQKIYFDGSVGFLYFSSTNWYMYFVMIAGYL